MFTLYDDDVVVSFSNINESLDCLDLFNLDSTIHMEDPNGKLIWIYDPKGYRETRMRQLLYCYSDNDIFMESVKER